MPWSETSPVEERIRFISDALSDRFTMSELCARYGVSRRVGYGSRDTRREGVEGCATGVELLITVHIASMAN